MHQNERAIQRAIRLCQKWHVMQEKLLNEPDPDKKLYWLYQESVLERRINRIEHALYLNRVSRSDVR